MKKSKAFAIISFILLTLVTAIIPFTSIHAESICDHLTVGSEIYKANGCGGTNTAELQKVVVNIVNGVVAALGLVAVIFIVVGGINYMTSAGDSSKIEKAKKTILYAVIGLVICALAFAIVNFAIDVLSSD